MFLLGLGQVVGQVSGVVFVDFGRDLVKPGDECVLDPVHKKFRAQHQQAVGSKGPKTFWKKYSSLSNYLKTAQ